MLSLLGVKGYKIPERDLYDEGEAIDREDVILPEIVVEKYEIEPAAELRPLLDTLWNAAGFQRSFNYLGDGSYKYQRKVDAI